MRHLETKQLIMSSGLPLPLGWASATINDLITQDGVFCDGDWVESKDQDPNGDVRLIQLADIGDGVYKNRSSRFLTKNKAIELKCTFLQNGDVLIARMPDPLGRACIFIGNSKPCVTVVDVCIVRPGEISIDPRWLMYTINSPSVRTIMTNLQSGSTRQRVSRSNLASIRLPIPPVAEQQLIVEAIEQKFSCLDEAVSLLRQAQKRLKRYRASVLKAAVEGELTAEWRAAHPDLEPAGELLQRILAERQAKWEEQIAKGRDPKKAKYEEPAKPDVSRLPELPEGWCWANLGQIASFQNGRPFPSKEYTHSGVKLLRPGNLYADGSVQWTETNTKYLPETWADDNQDWIIAAHELVMNLTAQPLKDEFLGRICITSENERCLLNQRLARITPFREVDRYYILYMLKSFIFRQFVNGLNTGSLIQHMFTSQLDAFSFPLPSLAEQAQIVSLVEERLSIINELESTIEKALKRAERQRRSILHQAFTGKLVAQNPEDEPASVLLERIRQECEQGKPQERARATKPAVSRSKKPGRVAQTSWQPDGPVEPIEATSIAQKSLWQEAKEAGVSALADSAENNHASGEREQDGWQNVIIQSGQQK